jgi:hypothetical protein
MASGEKKSRIDAQWQALQSGWGNKDYAGERKMLHETLDDGENIERLLGGGWKVLMRSQDMESHDRGIVVATGLRVLLLNKGRLSKNVMMIPYWAIETVKETGPEEVRITGPGRGLGRETYEMRLPASAAASFANLVQSRLLTDEASVKAMFSHILDSGESIEYWTHCSGGKETVGERAESDNQGKVKEQWWEADASDNGLLVVATDRRFLSASTFAYEDHLNVPYADLLTVICRGGSVKFAVLGRGEVYVIRPSRSADAQGLANLMQNHLATPGRPNRKRARILAEWQMQQPIWNHRKKRDKERNRLPEIMDDGERIEGLLSGYYHSEEEGETPHDGVVVATDHRLIFVSESIISGKHVSQLPYEGLAEVEYEKGRIHKEVRFISNPGYTSYRVSSMDDERPHNTRQSGYAEEFAVLVQGFLRHSTAPASASVAPTASRRSRNAQWRERSPGWKLDTHKNEREKLFDVLSDDENIERLVQGYYKADVKGAESHDVVIAATDRRIVFVYNGIFGEHVNELSYNDIERVEVENGFLSARITITGRAGVNNYVVNDVEEEGRDQFVDYVRSHLIASPAAPVAPAAPTPAPIAPVFPGASKQSRINAQWQERSPDWKLNTRRKERDKLFDVLSDDEDIERLVQGRYKADVKGAESYDVVVAATDRRIVFVYNGFFGEHVNEMPYRDIERVEVKDSLLSLRPRITITGRAGADNYVVEVEEKEVEMYREGMDLFADCVQSHLANSP